MKKPRILNIQRNLSIPWFEQIRKTVLLDGDSVPQDFYSIKPPDYVTILAQTVNEEVIILRQYRPVVEGYTLELPSGHVEKGETPRQAVIREFEEETCCRVEDVILLGEIIPDTGRLENRLWAFYANRIEVRQIADPRENEGIEVSLISAGDLIEMINNGKFNHALDLSVIIMAITKQYFKFEGQGA